MRRIEFGWSSFLLPLLALCALLLPHHSQNTAFTTDLAQGPLRVLAPISSGKLLIFPVVRNTNRTRENFSFLTLDEGLSSGDIEITEAGRARGLVRTRERHNIPRSRAFPLNDNINKLVLINHSDKPLLLLAGEIVTGGKQDRVIAKDRIIAPKSEPVDLSVFCIEPGRWESSSLKFNASSPTNGLSFMAQPTVRQRAMSNENQQEVWKAVSQSVSRLSGPAMLIRQQTDAASNNEPETSSYAKKMQDKAVAKKIDQEASPSQSSATQILQELQKAHAVGVVVAVHNELIWADVFASSDLLSRYWIKLIRSYAAESVTSSDANAPTPTRNEAQQFLNLPMNGEEFSKGEIGLYRYRRISAEETDTFILEELITEPAMEVHISKLKRKPLTSPEMKSLELIVH